MDISALNLTSRDVIEKMNKNEVHSLSEYVTLESYRKILEYLKSDKVVLVCVASSMTNLVFRHIEKPGVKAPLPSNFRITKNHFIEFDFPETVDVEKHDGILTLRFDKLMMGIMDCAAKIYEDNLRTIKPFQVKEILFACDGSIFMNVCADEYTSEWFKFILMTKEELTNER